MTPDGATIRQVCFICEWNEGRSAHLELSVRQKLRAYGSPFGLTSAGFRQGAGIHLQRQGFLAALGVPSQEIASHHSTVFSRQHTRADLFLVSELPMKARLLAAWPELGGRVMTIRGFTRGLWPATDCLTREQAHIEDPDGHTPAEKQVLYEEMEQLAVQVAQRLSALASEAKGCGVGAVREPGSGGLGSKD